MRAHVHAESPLEACGLVAGLNGHSRQIFPVKNELHSPLRYRFDPQEQLEAFFALEKLGWDLLAIYHSHPNGAATPSPTDISKAYYPEALHLIWGRSQGEWDCRAFSILGGQVTEVPLEIR